jgi:hypothetical protein
MKHKSSDVLLMSAFRNTLTSLSTSSRQRLVKTHKEQNTNAVFVFV